jgi:3',5'-cyclic AMP phosphodiesterase CpdA
MRIAHITDIHVTRPPRFSQIWGKRLWGSTQLYLLGRARKFSRAVQEELVRAVAETEPDVLVVTGDLTSQALPQEFEAFREIYAPLFEQQETIVLPGNHDTYTLATAGGVRADAFLQPWIGEGDYPRVRLVGDLAFVALCCARPGLYARGLCPEDQLARLDALLNGDALTGKRVLLLMHYPTRTRDGAPYDPYFECLANANAVEAVIAGHGARIQAILHGHVHHGYRTTLASPRGPIPILNPGTSGYGWNPKAGRTAHFNVVELDGGEMRVQRYFFDGDANRFAPESGGAYSTGR